MKNILNFLFNYFDKTIILTSESNPFKMPAINKLNKN
jgi:hypothetical protein